MEALFQAVVGIADESQTLLEEGRNRNKLHREAVIICRCLSVNTFILSSYLVVLKYQYPTPTFISISRD
jgi:hypothetical protein